MSSIDIEIKFNSKSSGQGVEDAMKIADKHEKSFEGKYCVVKFASIDDPDIEKLLTLIGHLKGSKVLVNKNEYKPKKVMRTFFCDQKLLCKGICRHPRIRNTTFEDFFFRYKDYIKDNQLIVREYVLQIIFNFVEPQEENTYLLKKDLLLNFFLEQTEFESQFCPKYKKDAIEKLIQQFPEKFVLESADEIQRRRVSRRRPRERHGSRSSYPQQIVNAYYQAQVTGKVMEHYLRKVLSESFPKEVASPKTKLDPESLILNLQIIPEDQKGEFYVSLAKIAEKDKKIEFFTKAITFEKNPILLADHYLEFAGVYYKKEAIDEAVTILKEGVDKCEVNFVLLKVLADIEVERENFQSAINYLKQALEQEPTVLDDIRDNPSFEPLQDLPEYREMVRQFKDKH